MQRFIDILLFVGIIVASVGVFLEFGFGFALIFAGFSAIGTSLIAARIINVSTDTNA